MQTEIEAKKNELKESLERCFPGSTVSFEEKTTMAKCAGGKQVPVIIYSAKLNPYPGAIDHDGPTDIWEVNVPIHIVVADSIYNFNSRDALKKACNKAGCERSSGSCRLKDND